MSSEENGKPVSLKAVIAHVLESQTKDDGTLCRDMIESHPGLRSAVLGGPRRGHVWPAARMSIDLYASQLVLRLEIAVLEVEARWIGSSIFGLFETANEDLMLGTEKWEPNWKGRERMQRKMLS